MQESCTESNCQNFRSEQIEKNSKVSAEKSTQQILRRCTLISQAKYLQPKVVFKELSKE